MSLRPASHRRPAARHVVTTRVRHPRRKDRARKWLAATAAAGVAALAALATATPPAVASSATPPHSATGNSTPLHTALPPTSAPTVAASTAPGSRGTTSGGGNSVAVGGSDIPTIVEAAYIDAQRSIAASDPGCHLSWTVLAGIGQVESGQANDGNVTANGTTRTPILGPVLNGTSGNAAIPASSGGGWARAAGPMQFIPTTWATWGADGNGDHVADPNNVYDAALAAGHYLCADGRDLAHAADLDAAILSYNNSPAYLATVTAWITYYQHHTTPAPTTSSTPLIPGGSTPTTSHPTPSTSAAHPTIAPTATRTPTPPPSRSASPTSRPTPTPASPRPTATPSSSPTPPGPVCSPTSSPTPTSTTTPTPSHSATPTPTGTASPTASPTPSSCTTPTTTPTRSGPAAPSP
ncbi:lytic transglycosylase domain-containing protein [Streptacidiphilus sp. MAP5-3]|uniref:lytic transglycosylase domain-containing protein n=1 Tax=unclassified Streptacidiphilus TaxID=2643834 RepID=UPI003514376C